jgi:hypothetical protein
MKLENHRPLVKLGISVAASGFTNEFEEAMKRAGRAEFSVVRVDLVDVRQFVDGPESFAPMERLLLRSL